MRRSPQCGLPRREINTTSKGEILRDHGSVKSDHAGGVGKISQQCRDVAITNKNLRVREDFLQIESAEQVIAAISAARTDNRAHIVPLKHLLEFASATLNRSR